jgi:hypothetical protein
MGKQDLKKAMVIETGEAVVVLGTRLLLVIDE